jgi:hypothetical protein
MPRFRFLLEGRNALVELDGELRRMGFYVTRSADGHTLDEAKARVLEELSEEISGKSLNERSNPVVFQVAEHKRMWFWQEVPDVLPGFAWFPMEDVDE